MKPELIFAFFPVIILPTVAFILGRMYFSSKKKRPEEEGLTPILSVTCSGIIDSLRYTGPFIRLTFYDDFIVLAYTKSFVLKYEDILDIRKEKISLVYEGLAIIHNRPDLPKKIILGSYEENRILEVFSAKAKNRSMFH